MYYIHYPSGGFGHFMLQMCSICFDEVFCPQEHSTFSDNGNSHAYPLHWKTWFHNEPYEKKAFYNFANKKSICLIDSGIDNDADRNMPNTIRMCIDNCARSIVFQTCREKAEHSTIDINDTNQEWEIREKYTLLYHHTDQNNNFYLSGWQPVEGCTNINISDLFFDPEKIIKQLTPHFGKCNMSKFWSLWNDFVAANNKYYKAQQLVNRVNAALDNGTDFEFNENYSLHDQGYLIYWLEKCYNIDEIPTYDYRNWFKNTQEVRTCLNSILSQ